MTARQQRMLWVGIIFSGVVLATILVLTAIGENKMFFSSPTQIKERVYTPGQSLRVGGLVVEHSVKRASDGLTVLFDLTDNREQVTVEYTGILPDLFREGQGIVATGQLDPANPERFLANEVLAKHDENYMPPEVAEALQQAKETGAVIEIPHLSKPAY